MKKSIGLLIILWVLSNVMAQSRQLLQTAQSGTLPEVQALIDAGADVNAVNERGETALMLALRDNPQGADIARAFIRARADVNVVSQSGETALSIARQTQDSGTITMLMVAGAREAEGAQQNTRPIPPSRQSQPQGLTMQPTTIEVASTDIFEASNARGYWTINPNVLGGQELVVPHIRFNLANTSSEPIRRLSIRAIFLLLADGGRLERLGDDTEHVVGFNDVPLDPNVIQEVRLTSSAGYVNNNSATIQNIRDGLTPFTQVDLYYRTEGDWVKFDTVFVPMAFQR